MLLSLLLAFLKKHIRLHSLWQWACQFCLEAKRADSPELHTIDPSLSFHYLLSRLNANLLVPKPGYLAEVTDWPWFIVVNMDPISSGCDLLWI